MQTTISGLNEKITVKENDIKKTEGALGEQDQFNAERHAELSGVERNISEKNTTIKEKNDQIGDFGKKIDGNNSKITNLEARKKAILEKPENFEATGSSNNTNNDEIKKIDAEIASLKSANAEFVKNIENLKNQVTQLMSEVKVLEGKRDNLQNNIIPAIEREIVRLKEVKASQESDKNSLVVERDDDVREMEVLDGEIQAEQKIIADMHTSISRSNALYAENIEREMPERTNLLTQMSSELVSVFA